MNWVDDENGDADDATETTEIGVNYYVSCECVAYSMVAEHSTATRSIRHYPNVSILENNIFSDVHGIHMLTNQFGRLSVYILFMRNTMAKRTKCRLQTMRYDTISIIIFFMMKPNDIAIQSNGNNTLEARKRETREKKRVNGLRECIW